MNLTTTHFQLVNFEPTSEEMDGQLDLFREPARRIVHPALPPAKLYLTPKPIMYGDEEFDPDSQHRPCRIEELPELREWVSKYLYTLLEIWGGKRAATQLSRWTHRSIYGELIKEAGRIEKLPKIRKLYISEPIEGVAETIITLRFEERVRSLILRFEGLDQRWICTELKLL